VHDETPRPLARLGRHLRGNAVGYLALVVAVSMTPLPSWAAATIGTAQIKNGAVTTKKLANGAVKTSKIAPSAVNGTKVADGSLGKNDLAAAARGFTSITMERRTVEMVPPNTFQTVDVDCGAGRVAIAGGGYAPSDGGDFGSSDGTVPRSHPINFIPGPPSYWAPAADATTARGWRSLVENPHDFANPVFAYAVCASK
jgi:hypothetical protein